MKTPVFQAIKDLDYGLVQNEKGRNMTRPHYHDGYELYLQTEGTREIFFQHDKYLLLPGTLRLIYPHIFHAVRSKNTAEKYSRYIVNFSANIFSSFLRDSERENIFSELSSCIIQLNSSQTDTVIEHIKSINKYWSMQINGISRGKKLAYIEVYRLLDSIAAIKKSAPDMLNGINAPKISDSDIYYALLYIDMHYMEEIKPADAMKVTHMSKSSFYRSFKEITGDSFSHYLNKVRAAKAHELLSQTKLPLYRIAEKTGFASTSHMTRIFKEIHGISPTAYRRS